MTAPGEGEIAPPPTGADRSPLLFDDVTELPRVPLLLGRIEQLLAGRGALGLLTVNIVQERSTEQAFGWQAFDEVLRQTAKFLAEFKRDHLRREDDVAEMMVNGNAFVILLAPPRDRPRIETRDLERIRQRILEPLRAFLAQSLSPSVTGRFGCYVGCAVVEPEPGQRAERGLYQALDQALTDSLRSRARAAEDRSLVLRQLLRERQISPVYQPVVDLMRRRVIGYEALSRVPTRFFSTVEHMFRVAQEVNATWELERLCREKALGMLGEFPRDLSLFLNVEPDSIYDPHFRGGETLELLERAGLRPQQVVLEVTEHSGVKDFHAFRRSLERFRSNGFRLAIDDVGSAYSGLQSIAEVAPDFIKIDMSLTRDLHRNSIKRDLIHTISRFSGMTGISLIAEGVESSEELRELQRIGVVLAQGYLFARPENPLPSARLDLVETEGT